MQYYKKWAVVVPMANEEGDFSEFVDLLTFVLDSIGGGCVYMVVDKVSVDRTLEMCRERSSMDSRYVTVWAPENRNVVDAYVRGLQAAFEDGHELIIEMDAGMSHDPRAIPMFLRVLNEGNECAFGSRFINGGSMGDSSTMRRLLSKVGTILSNVMLGTKLHDMTSGYQGFHRDIVASLIGCHLRSTAHFYQTEVRYLLRDKRIAEVPIHYQAPSPRVSKHAIANAFACLLFYFGRRVTFRSASL